MLTSYNNLISERDKLLANYNSLNIEKGDILTINKILAREKNDLQAKNMELNIALDKQKTRCNTIRTEIEKLRKEKDFLQYKLDVFGE